MLGGLNLYRITIIIIAPATMLHTIIVISIFIEIIWDVESEEELDAEEPSVLVDDPEPVEDDVDVEEVVLEDVVVSVVSFVCPIIDWGVQGRVASEGFDCKPAPFSTRIRYIY